MLKPPFRQFVIYVVKAPLQKAIEKAASLLPEPTLENTYHPNSHKLIKIRDRFMEYEDNNFKIKLFKAAFNLLIIEYEHDEYYRDRFDWIVEVLREIKWRPRMINHPVTARWREHRHEMANRRNVPIT